MDRQQISVSNFKKKISMAVNSATGYVIVEEMCSKYIYNTHYSVNQHTKTIAISLYTLSQFECLRPHQCIFEMNPTFNVNFFQ